MSLNKVMLIGNVGADPEIRYIDGGVCTASLSLATQGEKDGAVRQTTAVGRHLAALKKELMELGNFHFK